MYYYIYILLVCIYISINYILKNLNKKIINFLFFKKFLVILRVDFRERENCDIYSIYRVF